MSPYRRGLEKKLLPSFVSTPLVGEEELTCRPHRHSALSKQDKLVHTQLLKQDGFLFYSYKNLTFLIQNLRCLPVSFELQMNKHVNFHQSYCLISNLDILNTIVHHISMYVPLIKN